jgi:hypothetical protein
MHYNNYAQSKMHETTKDVIISQILLNQSRSRSVGLFLPIEKEFIYLSDATDNS